MVSGSRAWLRTAAGMSPILASPIQKAFAALKRSGTWTVILSRKLPSLCRISPLGNYRFWLQIFLQPEYSALPTNSRLFEPSEGSKRIVAYCIDQDPSGSNFSRHTVRPFQVRRTYVGDKPEFRIIGHFNGFGLRLVC